MKHLSIVTNFVITNIKLFDSTVSYGFPCFAGANGCSVAGYNGNGITNLGNGHWGFVFMVMMTIEIKLLWFRQQ